MVEFGLTVSGEAHCSALSARPPEFCRFIEIPGGALDSLALRRTVGDNCARNGLGWGVRDLVDPELARNLAEAGDTLRFEALRKFESRARAALAAGAGWASLDLDVGRAVADGEYCRKMRVAALQLCGVLDRLKRDWTLYLPVRIPAPGAAAEPSRLLGFLHDLPLPQIEPAFELHPHEPGALTWGGMDKLRFAARFWRIAFAPASGNKLAAGALSRFLDAGELPPGALRVSFAPEGAGAADDYTLAQIAETVRKWGDGRAAAAPGGV